MNDLLNRTITIEKILDAPVELVWKAWTTANHIVKWWAPEGMDLEVIEHNFELGGKWKYTMLMPNGKEFISEGVYKEIIPLKKIITSADFRPMTNNVELYAFFEADGDKTKFTFSVIHETEDYCKQQEAMGIYNGWGSAFNRLNELLKTIS